MLRNIALGTATLGLLFATPAFAHHPSGAGSASGAGPIVTIPGTTLEKGQSSAAVVFEMIQLNPLSDAQLNSMHPHPHSLVSVGVPVINDLNGLQAEPQWRVLTGVAVAF